MMTTDYIPRSIEPVFNTAHRVIGYDGFLDGLQRVYCADTMVAVEIVLDELIGAYAVSEADLDAEADAFRDEAANCKACYGVHDIQCCPAVAALLME